MNRRNNSVIVLAIFFVCATTGLAQGSTMVDNFDYGSTTDTPISTGAAGDGWAGGWTGSNPRSGSYLPGGQLEYAGTGYNNALNPATTGGVDGLASNDANASAISDRAFTANQTGVVWISALAKFDAGTPDGETLIWLRSSASTATFISLRGGQAKLRYAGADSASTETFSTGVVHLMLAKLQINPSGNDTIEFWVDPDLSGGEAGLPTPLLSGNSTDALGAGLSGVGISFYIGGYIDAIRVSNDADGFQQVTGIPEPGSLSLLSIGGLAWILKRRKA